MIHKKTEGIIRTLDSALTRVRVRVGIVNKSAHSFMLLAITPEEEATLRCISIAECGLLDDRCYYTFENICL